MSRAGLLALVLGLAMGLERGAAATIEVGPERVLRLPSEAARVARDGDVVLIDPGQYVDCAVWTHSGLTIAGRSGAVVIRDKVCDDKAIFVTQGARITLRNLTFIGARASSHNGAGIRAQGADLTVERCRFIDNENGILAAAAPHSRIRIVQSEFRRSGNCIEACAHGIYVGDIAALSVERSRFSETHQGHHIKSRAARTTIVGNIIADGPTGDSSYLIDLPNGGDALIERNRMVKGPHSDNPGIAISIGAEGVTHPTRSIAVRGNSFVNAQPVQTVFVRNLTATPARLEGNRMVGDVIPLQGPGSVQ